MNRDQLFQIMKSVLTKVVCTDCIDQLDDMIWAAIEESEKEARNGEK